MSLRQLAWVLYIHVSHVHHGTQAVFVFDCQSWIPHGNWADRESLWMVNCQFISWWLANDRDFADELIKFILDASPNSELHGTGLCDAVGLSQLGCVSSSDDVRHFLVNKWRVVSQSWIKESASAMPGYGHGYGHTPTARPMPSPRARPGWRPKLWLCLCFKKCFDLVLEHCHWRWLKNRGGAFSTLYILCISSAPRQFVDLSWDHNRPWHVICWHHHFVWVEL